MKQNIVIEIKGLTDEGYFEGMLSPYGNVDQGGDVVERGAFTKTIQDNGNTRPLLWQHKADTPIGQVELVDTAEGLAVKGQLLMDLPEARKAYLLMKARIVKGLSIGYSTVKDSIENSVRRLKELKLFEASVVTFPMNPAALITGIKSETKGDFNQELLDVQLQDAAYQMRQALWRALDSAVWDGMTRAEIMQATAATLEQFQAAYMAFLPNYLDMLNREIGPSDRWKSNPAAMETKAGRKISAATRSVIESAISSLNALLTEEAGADDATTSEKEAAKQETKSEPVGDDHSAITPLIAELKGAFQWNR